VLMLMRQHRIELRRRHWDQRSGRTTTGQSQPTVTGAPQAPENNLPSRWNARRTSNCACSVPNVRRTRTRPRQPDRYRVDRPSNSTTDVGDERRPYGWLKRVNSGNELSRSLFREGGNKCKATLGPRWSKRVTAA